MITYSFATKYKVIEEDFLTKNGIKFSLIQNRNDTNLPLYLMRIIKKVHFTNDEHFLSYARTKIINIIDPIEVFIRENDYVLVFRNMEEFRFSEQKYKEKPYLTKIIFLQLSLTFAELSRRKIGWNISSLFQIYIVKNWVAYLSMQDLDDSYFLKNTQQEKNIWNIFLPNCVKKEGNDQTQEQTHLENFFKKNEPLFYSDQTEVLEEIQKFELVFGVEPTIEQTPLPDNLPYQEYIRIYFNPKISHQNIHYQQDEASFEFETPLIFKQNFNVQAKSIECRIYNDKYINQEREIEIQLIVINCPLILSAFCYMRIKEEAIFFYDQNYSCSLQDAFRYQPLHIDNMQYRNVAYKILNDILIAISYLHSFHIAHKKIYPRTCYLLEKELTKGNTYMLGNLGGSKIIQQQNIQVIDTQFNYNQDEQYMAPENIENYSIKSDIFQFGVLALYIMNRGSLPVQTLGLEKNQYAHNYSVQNLSNKLAQYDYPQDLIKNISQCLEFEPQNRPNAKDLVSAIQKIYHGSKIIIISQSKLQK